MANIEKRISKEGKTSYRVKVRLKGFPTQQTTFDRLTDARKWAHKQKRQYVKADTLKLQKQNVELLVK